MDIIDVIALIRWTCAVQQKCIIQAIPGRIIRMNCTSGLARLDAGQLEQLKCSIILQLNFTSLPAAVSIIWALRIIRMNCTSGLARIDPGQLEQLKCSIILQLNFTSLPAAVSIIWALRYFPFILKMAEFTVLFRCKIPTFANPQLREQ
ncbi:unnamed protein product [Gongylonema pulchrum]|uniref:Uncharacterized protein n=1 Tax=Gongylonema pulchrum TaxID=637853 RepID=A0A183E7S5_9BILA|nr:unnamed protein product [Gongylonema pulchrum]